MFRRLSLSLPIAGAVLVVMVMPIPAAQAGGYPAPGYKVSLNFNGMGPNGLVIVGDDIYAGNGDSHVLGCELRTGRLIADYNTGGKLQADELTVAGRYLVVTNSAESPHPFITFIDLREHRIVAKYTPL